MTSISLGERMMLRRITNEIESGHLVEAMTDLRLIFKSNPKDKTVKDLMRRCSDLPKMSTQLRSAYLNRFLKIAVKRCYIEFIGYASTNFCSEILRLAFLRQLFLSKLNLTRTSQFIAGSCVLWDPEDDMIRVLFTGWVPQYFVYLGFPEICISMIINGKLFNILHSMMEPKTLKLCVGNEKYMRFVGPLDKYKEVYHLTEVLSHMPIGKEELEAVDKYSNFLTRMLASKEITKMKSKEFPCLKIMRFDTEHPIDIKFLKLWKEKKWPAKDLVFRNGPPNFSLFKQFGEVISNNVTQIFMPFAEEDLMPQPTQVKLYQDLCNNFGTLKKVFPKLSYLNLILHYHFDALNFKAFMEGNTMKCIFFHHADMIDKKPEWCERMNVIILLDFHPTSYEEFKEFKFEHIKNFCVEMNKYNLDPIKLQFVRGPTPFDTNYVWFDCVQAIIGYKTPIAQFQIAFRCSYYPKFKEK